MQPSPRRRQHMQQAPRRRMLLRRRRGRCGGSSRKHGSSQQMCSARKLKLGVPPHAGSPARVALAHFYLVRGWCYLYWIFYRKTSLGRRRRSVICPGRLHGRGWPVGGPLAPRCMAALVAAGAAMPPRSKVRCGLTSFKRMRMHTCARACIP